MSVILQKRHMPLLILIFVSKSFVPQPNQMVNDVVNFVFIKIPQIVFLSNLSMFTKYFLPSANVLPDSSCLQA